MDMISTASLYTMLSQAAVSKAVALGHLQPTASGINVPVYRQNYMARTGSGNSTQFTPCGDESWGVANYNVALPVSGTLVVNLINSVFQTEFASGTCHSTFVQ